jgi:hypothetical protein
MTEHDHDLTGDQLSAPREADATPPRDPIAEPEPRAFEEQDDDPAYWDELASDTLRFLRSRRRAYRVRRAKSVATTIYGFVLLAAVYAGAYGSYWLHQVNTGHPYDRFTRDILAALPAGLTAGAFLVILLLAADAVWRGPVVLDHATVGWLLPAPITRARLTRPRFRRTLTINALLGALAGGVLGFVGHLLALGEAGGVGLARGIGGDAGCGLLLASVATGVAGLVESTGGRWIRRGPGRIAPRLVALALIGQTALAGVGTRGRGLETVELWSGPWGWASQPVLANAGVHTPGWRFALVLLTLLAVGLVVVADRAVGGVSDTALRARAGSVERVGAALFSVRPRAAWLALRDATHDAATPRLRLPAPRRRALVVVWRDATALLRAPGRAAWSLLWLVVAVSLAALAAGEPRSASVPFVVVLALCADYLGVAQLAEGARLDGDDPRRMSMLPMTRRGLAWRHAILPACCSLLAYAVAGAVLAVAHGPSGALLPLAAATPAFAGAALVNAFRRDPGARALVGVETPFGNTASVTTLLWHVRGPLVALVVGTPLTLWSLRGGLTVELPAAVLALALAVPMLRWGGSSAERV